MESESNASLNAVAQGASWGQVKACSVTRYVPKYPFMCVLPPFPEEHRQAPGIWGLQEVDSTVDILKEHEVREETQRLRVSD